MDLLAAIASHYASSPDSQTLRDTLGTDKLAIYEDLKGRTRPYLIVLEGGMVPTAEALGQELRIDTVVVLFNVFADSRSSCSAILDAIEDCFLSAELTTTGRVVLGRPRLDARSAIERLEDCYLGSLSLSYLVSKSAD